ncbi:MAG: type VI secretion system tip protein VgrG [Saprospiraceae bacterium]
MPNTRAIAPEVQKDTVTFTIKVDGQALDATFQVAGVTVWKEINRVASARLTLVDGDPAAEKFVASNAPVFLPGKEIEILAGYHSKEDTIFKGIVVRHSIRIRKGGGQLTVECKDPAVKMTLQPRSRYFLEKKDSEILEEIIGGYSLQKQVEATQSKHEEVVQKDLSDWDFLVHRADRNGQMVLTEAGKVQVFKPDFKQKPILEVQYGDTLLEFDAEIDARCQPEVVKASFWSQADHEWIEMDAKEPSTPAAGNVSASDLAGAMGFKTFVMSVNAQPKEEEVQSLADARLLRNRLARIRGRAAFVGQAKLLPGQLLSLKGVGERFEGDVFVSAVRHTLAEGNWISDAQFGLDPMWFLERPELPATTFGGLLSQVQGLQVGVVTQLEGDPGKEHRLRLKLPGVQPDSEGAWARIATLDAGDSRGSFFRPEIGDEVLVGFFDNDPRYPVVLGGLHSSAKPAPLEAKDDNHQKGFFSRSKMKFLWDDDKKSLELSTPAGNRVLLSEDEKTLGLQDQHGNKIVLDKSGITLESTKDITLKAKNNLVLEGNQLEAKAKTKASMNGNASTEVKSGGTLTIKGAMVQIN